MTDRVDDVSVENDAALSVYVFHVSACPQTNLFLRIKQIEDLGTLLRDVSLSHVASLRASLRLYDFNYSHSTLSVTCYHVVCAGDVTTPSTSSMTAGHEVLKNDAKVSLLD